MKEEKTYKKEAVPLKVSYKGKKYTGIARPLSDTCREGVCFELEVVLNDLSPGIIFAGKDLHWTMDGVEQGLVNAIGEEILLWYE